MKYTISEEEFDALYRDAERYRWLRADNATWWGEPWCVYRTKANEDEPIAIFGAELDAAIDAAMEEKK